jgi:hypothetical protein
VSARQKEVGSRPLGRAKDLTWKGIAKQIEHLFHASLGAGYARSRGRYFSVSLGFDRLGLNEAWLKVGCIRFALPF